AMRYVRPCLVRPIEYAAENKNRATQLFGYYNGCDSVADMLHTSAVQTAHPEMNGLSRQPLPLVIHFFPRQASSRTLPPVLFPKSFYPLSFNAFLSLLLTEKRFSFIFSTHLPLPPAEDSNFSFYFSTFQSRLLPEIFFPLFFSMFLPLLLPERDF